MIPKLIFNNLIIEIIVKIKINCVNKIRKLNP